MQREHSALLWTLMLGVFLGAADLNLIAPGLTAISHAVRVTSGVGAWLVTIYAIIYAVGLPIAGALGDRYGRRGVFFAGAIVFAVGSLLAGLSHTLTMLLIARGVQALGASALIPLATAEIGTAFSPARRGALLGAVGAVYGLAAVVGPPIGAVLVAYVGWRWLFFATVPIAAAVALLAALSFPEAVERRAIPLDILGALLTAAAVGALLLGFEFIHRGDLPFGVASIIFGALLLPNLGFWERSASGSIFGRIDLRGGMGLAYALGILSAAGMVVALFVPLYGLRELHLTEVQSGVALLPMALAAAVTSWWGGRLTDRVGPMPVLAAGFLLLAGGAYAVPALGGMVGLGLGLVLVGGGVGLTMGAPLQYLVLGLAPKGQSSAAVAMLGTFRALGTAAGPVLYASFLPVFAQLFLAAAGVGVAGLLAALLLWGSQPRPNMV
ncbi:MAG: MFS transporter [Thermaerobacter sp.]|nr:MFS transporter [Thermaerobacter sp.]